MFSTSSRTHRSSAISPFRSRKSPAQPLPLAASKSTGRPSTPSSTTSSRPPSRISGTPVSSGLSPTAQALDRPNPARLRKIAREINKGDEIAWYADGEHTVRNENNPSIAYGFDRVFGPATTTRHVYDVAAQHVVSGAMQGINGTVFAYGVTSSGKTHTMHGEQKSPGIIPLAVKDVFGIIQETPGREFLLRVSYLEIYNEVINDLLDPTGQNLRIREDVQGTYVEGIKEEVVLSPAHALSLIASGEEHRHVGSNNFNLLSSRSHTIFTLTIESSPRGENEGEEDVTLSQLNLIDLAGSESSKTETTGLRRKEGSYINKSLLTLGTLICTVTPASSNSEETHNTLKFAHRSKHVEIKASQNKIMDEKSLIKKYQKEISSLKQELQQLKRGLMENPYMAASTQEDLVNLKLQLAYLPDRKREYMTEEDAGSYASELSADKGDDITNLDELVNDYKRNRRRGMLGWFKPRKPENLVRSSPSADSGSSAGGSPASCSKSSQNKSCLVIQRMDGEYQSVEEETILCSLTRFQKETKQTGTTITDQMDLLREQVKMLAGEVALCTSSLKRLSEQASSNPEDCQLKDQMQKLKDEITEKKLQMHVLEQRMIGSVEMTPNKSSSTGLSQALSKLTTQLNEKILNLSQPPIAESDTLETCSEELPRQNQGGNNEIWPCEENSIDENTPKSVMSLNRIFSHDDSKEFNGNSPLSSQVLKQAAEIENLKQEKVKLSEENDGLEIRSQKLAEEATYAKELAATAAVELRNLAEEVTKLSYENAKLTGDLAAAKEVHCRSNCCQRSVSYDSKQNSSSARSDGHARRQEDGLFIEELRKKLNTTCQRESALEAVVSEKDKIESELRERLGEAKRREEDLENELANMWVLIAKMRMSSCNAEDIPSEGALSSNTSQSGLKNGFFPSNGHSNRISKDEICENKDGISTLDELKISYQKERRRCKELESLISRLKGEDIGGLDVKALEQLQNFHIEAITKISHAKAAF
ncbi:hypothetical protein GH714_023375 [Hevea brasiliensis]|uniref:Kinesin-like protein n=1 Tax=Hevea brasiliensis TaxID=3981 RepID=A0A6A6KTK8_HEVBR|nr:hypothetical protein GH714_023375 [Hevea brasiliensis]